VAMSNLEYQSRGAWRLASLPARAPQAAERALGLRESIGDMLNLIKFFGVLSVSGFVFRAAWRRIISPVNGYFLEHEADFRIIQVGWFCFQMYIVCGWAAFCSEITNYFTSNPTVSLTWLLIYEAFAFTGCITPPSDRC
jgi:hypothetical protein